MRRTLFTFITGLSLVACSSNEPIPAEPAEPKQVQKVVSAPPVIVEEAPVTYTVKRGDTLWDISAKFLENPWMWPEIWHVNAQIPNPHRIYPGDVIRLSYVNGKPRLTVNTANRIHKLEPKARVVSVGEAIDTIPLDRINSFLSRTRIVEIDEFKLAPYMVSGADDHLIVGTGDRMYARDKKGVIDENESVYGIYRQGDAYVDPITKEQLGIQALDIGSGALLKKEGEIATLEVTRITEEVRIGDSLLQQEERAVDSTFFPASPDIEVDGLILAVEGGLSQVGKMDIVVLNRGEREGLAPGHVLSVYKRGSRIRDRVTGEYLTLPDEKSGLVMVFRSFEKLSLALVLEASQGITVKDYVRNPE